MPASTLPTRSPPTSAPLVKMPPPNRAKIEISEAPKPSATIASIHGAVIRARDAGAGEEHEIKRHAEQREAGDQEAGDRAGPEGELEAAGERADRGLRGAHIGAHRHVHADEAGGAREDRADRKADRHEPAEEDADDHEDHDADNGDRGVLPPQIGLRALAHGRGNFLHLGAAGIGAPAPNWSPRWRREAPKRRRER